VGRKEKKEEEREREKRPIGSTEAANPMRSNLLTSKAKNAALECK